MHSFIPPIKVIEPFSQIRNFEAMASHKHYY
ncbi:hypothetical protein SERP1885 [Staphylococcus epidermidis RP62A]|uniref:Uncharacterized protein n=1 Tax=Staphylococcus epidermidis (strain ATCC 35984 / DSM 28319 / BCRC 17069 / CCUG 31568 / BM 3577 / RP62A) TaxID=176279 RepID=Q5HLU7_STAEQ|nr:hypothetical protein SERP1885 [Staphylococcus epidermidis RP62A]